MDRQIGARRLRTRNTGWAGHGAVRRFWLGFSGLGVARGGRLRKVRSGFIRAGRLRTASCGEARSGMAVLVRLVRYGVVWWVLMRRLWWGSLGRHRELHGGCGPALSGLAGRGLAVAVRRGRFWSGWTWRF